MASFRDPVARAKDFMDTHFDQPLDLDVVAQQAHFSPYHFLRRFRQTYAETPHAYLTRMRMARARELLVETELSVTEVCLDVGYTSLGSFSSSFRRHVGHSPYNYRARVFQSVAIVQAAARYIPYCYIFMRGLGQKQA
ncbi:MAG: AraC family transcriptional regulator [Litorilinea sp.]